MTLRMVEEINGKKIHYIKMGSGDKAMLLVHGWGGSHKSLRKLQESLSKDRLTYSIDLPGFGRSDLPAKTWGVEEYAAHVVAFIKKMKLESVIYLGHSFGGALGIYIAANYPDLIDKLILCAPSFKRSQKYCKLSKYEEFKFFVYNIPGITLLRKIFYKVFNLYISNCLVI